MTMTITRQPGVGAAARRIGYGVAVVVNLGLLIVVNNLEEWDLLPWLTEEFSRVVPIISLSLAASAAVNLIFIGYDPRWFKALGQLVLNMISLAAVLRLLTVFPFDFSAYEFGWATLTRVVLGFVAVVTAIAILVEGVKFVRELARI
jgi:hypothetical protein